MAHAPPLLGVAAIVCLPLIFLTAPSAARTPYIVGGLDSLYPGRWPWQGSLQWQDQHLCGCALISDRWLVTASHCVEDPTLDHEYFTVVMGAYDINTQLYGAPRSYGVKKAYKHPDYYTSVWGGEPYNDIALLELNEAVEFNQYVKTITLPETGANFEQSPCYITGWGAINGITQESPNVLQEAATREVPFTICNSDDYWIGQVNLDKTICVAGAGAPGACSGDSGGPLVCRIGTTWYLAGATSWGQMYCSSFFPSVYARVSNYRSWIKSHTGI